MEEKKCRDCLYEAILTDEEPCHSCRDKNKFASAFKEGALKLGEGYLKLEPKKIDATKITTAKITTAKITTAKTTSKAQTHIEI